MVKPQAVATVTNCNFTSNSAWTGGAILNLGELTIEKSEFTENEANLNGGAINNNEGKLRILNSVFTKNMVTTKSMPHGYGGGAICNTGDLEINNTAFTENTAVYGGAINNDKDLRIIDSKFHKNIATGVLCGGGAINNKTGTVTMLKSELKKNESEVHGGAIFNRKGMISITSCEFTENASKNGGAIENHGKSDITESIIGKNTANGKGGAIFNGGELNIMESTLNDNRSDEGEGAIHDDEDAKSSVAKCTIERNKSKKKEDASSERGGLEKLFEEYFSDN
jgi:hypothetical protein